MPEEGPGGVFAAPGPVKIRIVRCLVSAGSAGLTRQALMIRVYGGDPGGGPESYRALNVHRWEMRGTLARFGLQIVSRFGPGATWYLRPLSRVQSRPRPKTRGSRGPAP